MTTPRTEPRPLRRILLTLDGSPFAECALRSAVTLASMTGGELRLLSALEIPPLFVYPEFRSDDRVAAEAYLARIAAGIEGVSGVTTSVREGRVGDEILREAADWNADVIVMASHGRGGPARLWMGSTTDRCVRESRRPVLVVRPRESGGVDPAAALSVSRVVLPLDGSEAAEAAIPYGTAIARALGVPLALLRIVTYLDTPETAAPGFNAGLNQDLLALETENASDYLRPLAEEARRHGLTVTTSTPRYLRSGPGILSEAGSDLVVMATRGRGGMRRGLLGSTADKVVRGAVGPVLVVPPETPEHA